MVLRLKNGCSPGFDGTMAELFKYSDMTTAQLRVKLLEAIYFHLTLWQSPCGVDR